MNKKKKVWIIHYEYHASYKSKNLGLFARYMSKRYDVEFLTTKIMSYIPFEEKNIVVKEFSDKSKNLLNKKLVFYVIKNIKDVDYIWCYNTHPKFLIILLILSKIFNTKVIIKLDSVWILPKDNLLSKLKYKILNLFFLMSYKLLYESDKLKEKIPKILHNKCFKYMVTYSEIFGTRVGLEELIKMKENIILISARIYENKNIHTIIDIFIKNKILFKNWKLIIMGDDFDKKYANNLKKRVRNCNNILFVGFKTGDEYYQYFKKAKIFVLPSYQEGQPNVLVEAIYFGCKVLITKNANINEFVDDKYVELINPYDKNDILQKLKVSISNYNDTIIQHNHEKVKKNFLFEEQIKKLIND